MQTGNSGMLMEFPRLIGNSVLVEVAMGLGCYKPGPLFSECIFVRYSQYFRL